MSRAEFSDDCPGCRPALLDERGRLPDDSPEMKAVDSVWECTTKQERLAFHRVTCLNSRDPRDLVLLKPIVMKMSLALKELDKCVRLPG